jgi:hypothetical protein
MSAHGPTDWSINNNPAAATQASITRAAVTGIRHICTSISFVLSTGAAAQATVGQVALRDGTTGAGSVLWAAQAILPANGLWSVSLSDLAIPGTNGNAMTLEFVAAGVAGSFQSVNLTGYDSA